MYSGLNGSIDVLRKRFEKKKQAEGFYRAFFLMLSLGFEVILSPFFKIVRGKRQFVLLGQPYNYFCHWYNTTFSNERAVEMAITLVLLNVPKGKKILEVGNVLSHYMHIEHDVVDKYEKADDVINEDILDYSPTQLYDLIISISTLEHVGFDEIPCEPLKIVKVLTRLRSLLSSKGNLFATIPIGYNPNLNTLIDKEELFDKQYFMERVSQSNEWVETTKEKALKRVFDRPFPFANAILIGVSGRNKNLLRLNPTEAI